jgi:hypothetical protein
MARPDRRFCFRLAAHLGCTVRELLVRLGADELTEWIAFDQIEPFGRTTHQLAMLSRLQIKGDADVVLEDLIPFYRQPPPPKATELTAPERSMLSRRLSQFFRKKAGR